MCCFCAFLEFSQRRREVELGATFNHQGPSAPAARWEKHGEILIIAPQIACVWFGSLVLVLVFGFGLLELVFFLTVPG